MRSIRFTLGAFALTTLVFASCKKDYTCTCNQNGTYYIHYDYTNMEEEGAKAACAADEALLEQETSLVMDCSI